MRSRYRRATRRYGRASLRSRRSARTTRAVRRRPRARTSRRRILNITSQKKSDSLGPGTSTAAGVITPGSLIINSSGTPTYIAFSPTQRIQSSPGLTSNQSFNPQALRTNQRTFAKGYAEAVRLTWDNGTSWTWRRIVFSVKQDPTALAGATASGLQTASVASFSQGATPRTIRVVTTLTTSDGGLASGLVFKGGAATDFNDIATAQVDRDRIHLHYDRVTVLNCPSGTTTTRICKFYHKFNKNLYYNDDEFGVSENTGWSASGSSPLGDVYVLDMFESATNPGTPATLQFNPTGTYYWHER